MPSAVTPDLPRPDRKAAMTPSLGPLAQLYAAHLAGTLSRRSFVLRATAIGQGTGAMALLATSIRCAA